jgi:hypothetical protein
MRARPAVAAALLLALSACRSGVSEAEAERLVRRYCERIVEAYRTSDAELVEPLVSPEQATKLAGLIGVKRDTGVVLDATLHELAVERVEPSGDDLLVVTRERWEYRDRKLGSGEPAGPASNDRYRVRYTFAPAKERRVLRRVEFVDPPVIDRGPEASPWVRPPGSHGGSTGDGG